MTGTVIDALVIELGFDTKDLEKGRKTLTDFFTKVTQSSDKSSKQVVDSTKKQTEGFTKLRNELVALLAVFTAGKGIKQFVVDITDSNAALYRFSTALGLNTRDVAQWKAAADVFGVSANAIAGDMKRVTLEMQNFNLYGKPSQFLSWLRQLDISPINETTGKIKDNFQIMLDLADRLKGMDPARANAILTGMGYSDDTIQIILQGRDAVQKLLASQKEYADILARDAPNAEARLEAWRKLRNALTGLAVDVLSKLTPVIVTLTNEFTKFFNAHPDLGKALIIGLAGGIGILTAAITAGGFVAAFGLGSLAIGGLVAAGAPLLLTLGEIAAAITAIVAVSNHWREIWSSITGLFGGHTSPTASSNPPAPSAAVGGGAVSGRRAPLSVRNNNPGNLRSWGNTPVSGGFARFATAQDGISAAAGNLMNYSKRGWSTPQMIAAHWAPAGDGNNVDAYAKAIASAAGVGVNDILDINNPAVANKVLGAIFQREAGYSAYSQSQVASGIADRMARYRGQSSSQYASAVSQTNSSSVNTATSTTYIGTLVVNSSAQDAAGIAGDVHAQILARGATVQQGNTGPT